MEPYRRIGVIVGFPRSGTTLLRSMLAEHPKLDVLEVESHYILDLYRQFGYRLSEPRAAIQFLVEHRKFPATYAEKDAVVDALGQREIATLSELLQCFFRLLFPAKNDTLIIKYPALVGHLDVVSGLFPNIKVLNVIRDPRAAIASHRARWPSKSVAELSIEWAKAIESASRWQDANSARYADVIYERLLLNPVDVLQNVSSLLSVDNAPEMLDIDFNQSQWSLQTPGEELHRHFDSLDTSKIEEWRTRLRAVDVALIESRCARLMAEYGYELMSPPLKWSERIQYGRSALGGRSAVWARRLRARL